CPCSLLLCWIALICSALASNWPAKFKRSGFVLNSRISNPKPVLQARDRSPSLRNQPFVCIFEIAPDQGFFGFFAPIRFRTGSPELSRHQPCKIMPRSVVMPVFASRTDWLSHYSNHV